jgi:hypothetical protein
MDVIPIREQAEAQSDHDAINPPHYKGTVECIDAIHACLSPEAFRGALVANAMKYLWRLNAKGSPLENARKAQWYVSRLVYELSRKDA